MIKYGYSAAMPPIYAGDIHGGKFVYAEVTNNDTTPPRRVIVKVNDVGPFPVRDKDQNPPKGISKSHEDATRAIDLSAAAYAKIAKNPGDGVLNVTVKFLKPEEGERRYNEQNKWAAEHKAEIKQQVHKALCATDRKYSKKHNCG
ncbi:MAG: hypothetical protein HQK99_15475 [Nitrospirae bacterium]|nr:hypothetical protein [Nitrospirota bacterium]